MAKCELITAEEDRYLDLLRASRCEAERNVYRAILEKLVASTEEIITKNLNN